MNSIAKYTQLLNRFPKFELSYETVSHKKVSNTDSIAIAISLGRKYFIWHTYKPGSNEDVCYLIGLDKDKQICSVEPRTVRKETPAKYKFGTIVYGTIYEHQRVNSEDSLLKIFIAEDIYYHCGVNLSNLCFGDRIGFLREFVIASNSQDIALPIMWYVDGGKEQLPIIPPEFGQNIGYTVHHIQYREIRRVAPYINVAIPKKGTIPMAISAPISSAKVAQKITATSVMNPIPKFDFSKPTYRYPAVFNVTADPQLDLYHLYAYGGGGSRNEPVYCGLACVQSLKTSVFMNKLFRRIRENDNLDLAEESEDDDDFENTDTHKYVNLDAIIPIECAFNQKHKKWMPVCLANKNEKVIHIEKLVAYPLTANSRENTTFGHFSQNQRMPKPQRPRGINGQIRQRK
jgi:hypothetical protein